MIFQVTGYGAFPVDMLRYDRCSPASECDSAAILRSFNPSDRSEHVVNLFRPVVSGEKVARPPTTDRWRSFAWEVVPADQERTYTCGMPAFEVSA